MYIIKVLIEHPVHALDTTFDYLYHIPLIRGVRVFVEFNKRKLVGYVDHVIETHDTKEELENKAGFKYHYILEVIDEEPLLNEELQNLALQLSNMTLSPRISCLQAMLPTQLKPSSSTSVGVKYKTMVALVSRGNPKTKKQNECLQYLYNHPFHDLKDIPFSKTILDALQKQGFIRFVRVEDYRKPLTNDFIEHKNIILTNDQQYIVDEIMKKEERISLIYGVTGSGKTEVYLALAKEMLDLGKSVMMLVPEISLTPMMVDIFKQRFHDDVAVLHSRLTQGEKYDEYRRIKRQEVKIVVGARSAIFAPLENIGLIILDEEHDASYKQDSKPRYLTSQIAKIRAQYHHARVVLGSATPSLESYSRAKKGVYDLYKLTQRINKKPLPHVEVIDMVEEMKNHNYSLFSARMKNKIQQTIDKNEQVILLLNKRGYATYVRCNECGELVKCPHCDVTLTYHKDENKLKCHYCEYQIPYHNKCEKCGCTTMKTIGYGTQKIEEQIEKMFRNAHVIRYDIDSTKNKNGHLKLLEKFKNKEANILLGTQMIAKGLDFEDVTFVGVLNADISMNIPDFRSNERTFQLLTQVAGRSGRGSKEGEVMIQTYNPTHYAITSASSHDYETFYNHEMIYRQKMKYPPFCHLVSVIIQSKNENHVDKVAREIKEYLDSHLSKAIVLGPAQSAIYKMQNIYRQRILIKFVDSQQIYVVLNKINEYYNKQQKGKVNVICDFNPYSQI